MRRKPPGRATPAQFEDATSSTGVDGEVDEARLVAAGRSSRQGWLGYLVELKLGHLCLNVILPIIYYSVRLYLSKKRHLTLISFLYKEYS